MRFLLLVLLVCSCSHAEPWTYRQNTASVNLAATFTTLPMLSGPSTKFSAMQIDNRTAGEIEVNCSRGSVPGSNSTDSFYVDAYSAWVTPRGINLDRQCWLRSVSGTLSSGVIVLTGWGE